MKRYIPIILVLALIAGCKQKTEVKKEAGPQFTVQLTDAEKQGGVMTPEILWKFGRLGSLALSPDGKSVLYTVTEYSLDSQINRTNIFKMPVTGGDAVQLTTDGGNSPQWINNGETIAYIAGGKLSTMGADGSSQKSITGPAGFEIFNVSPDGKKIYFTRRVKLDQTANEKHNLQKANVRIINDLMYRHWNYWHDYSYSHVFVASFDGSEVTDEKDIMEGQRYESPDAPYFDEGEMSWSPDSKYIAYSSKRMTGIDYARSTNTDIFLYNISTGEEVNITEGNMGYDKYPVFSPDGTRIAYQSMEEDGYEADLYRLFVYDIASGERTWVTRGWQFDVENVKWADNQTVYFTCSHLGTTQIFKLSVTGGEVIKVTEGKHNLGPIDLESGVLVSGLTSMEMATEVEIGRASCWETV